MSQKVRKVTIIFTDIEGYTSMMQKNEASTIELVSQLQLLQRKEIEKSGGTVVKELGDGLLAWFENANTAIQCMINIQSLTSAAFDTRIRCGMHEADVVFSDHDILGDGVNIASRIEPLADPGGIYISGDLAQSIDQDLFEIKHLGKAKLKGVEKRTDIYAILSEELPEPSISRFNELANPRKKFPVIPTIAAFVMIIAGGIFSTQYFERKARVSEAEASVLQVRELVRTNWRDFSEAYELAKEVERVIPEDNELKELIDRSSVWLNVTTEPENADIYYKLFKEPESEWRYLGKSPIDSAQLPKCALRWKIEKPGYETVLAASLSSKLGALTVDSLLVGQDFHRDLFPIEDHLENMVYVPQGRLQGGSFPPFFIDKYEVTNEEFMEFVQNNGYSRDIYWSSLSDHVSDTADWKEIRSTFVDLTNKPGPSTWANGSYPEGQANHPVTGISWYEAVAYAKFVNKDLPTKDHWGLAYGVNLTIIRVYQMGGNALFAPFRNFHGDGTWPVGSSPGIDPYGTFDMGGNVREWCWNESRLGRWMRGGSYVDNPYMGLNASQSDPFDRSAINGFRCVSYIARDEIPKQAFEAAPVKHRYFVDDLPDPITENEFEIIRALYDYDKTPLNVVNEWAKERENWTLEKVSFNAAYEDEKVTAYLFLPKEVDPPYQTVLYGYGSGAFMSPKSDDIENYYEFSAFLEWFANSGRAVVMPIAKGTFERGNPSTFATHFNHGSHNFTDLMTKLVKDYRRTIDYLETRSTEFDMNKLCFYGISYGPFIGQFLTGVDDRVDTNIFYAGATTTLGLTESNPMHFLPRIKIPTLMINGRYDAYFRFDHEVKYMHDLLGTPIEKKKLLLYDSDHLAPRADVVRETLIWLDSQFGTVKSGEEFAVVE